MPSKSGKQHRLMAMVAHDPKAAKRLGIPQSVGKEYVAADKGKKFKEGGMALFKGKETPAEERKEAKALKSGKISKVQYVAGEKKEGHGAGAAKKAAALKSGKMSVEKYAKEHKYASGGTTKAGKSLPESKDMGGMGLKKGGSCKGYKGGGVAEPDKPTPQQEKEMRQQVQDMRQKKASSEAYEKVTGKKFARGGGVELRGKTKGKFI